MMRSSVAGRFTRTFSRSIRQRNRASVLTPFVNEVPDSEAAERDAFAQFADIGHGLGGCHCLGGHDGWFLLGEGFQGAGHYLLGRVVATGAEVRHDELLAVRVEGQGESHGSVSPGFGDERGSVPKGCWCRAEALDVLHLKQMSNTLTVRLPEDLAEWLEQAARTSGLSRGGIVRMELERARKSPKRPFLRMAGAVDGPADLSMRKGFSRK